MTSCERLDRTERLDELNRYDLLDTSSEEAFDRVTRLICRLFSVSMSTVTLIDGHRQWFKSRQGVQAAETERDFAFCRLPMADDRPLIVTDTLADTRFRENPHVINPPHLRFYAGVPIRSSRGITIGTLCAMDGAPRSFSHTDLTVLTDLGRLVETEFELRLQAGRDSLTGALSRGALRQETERAMRLADRHRHDLSCIFFDIDHFKSVNDEYGHATGDAVLRHVVRATSSVLRKSDIVGRVGGEEFAIVLPHTSASHGVQVAEKVRQAIAAEVIPVPHGNLRVTASFGVAWLEAGVGDIDALIERADDAMYRAKHRGRNCTVLWQSDGQDVSAFSQKVVKAGQIVFNGGKSAISCTVRRLSGAGARIDTLAPEGLPQRFKLSIPTEAFSRACTFLNRENRHVEVAFE